MSGSCLLVRIEGRVQGVCFRHYTREEARRLGIGGWVRNCPDGSVEALICGDRVEAMLAWLQHGPAAADVTKIVTTPANPKSLPTDFRVTHQESGEL